MKKISLISVFLCVIMFSGCSSKVVNTVNYDTSSSARLRIFGMNGIRMVMYPGMNACEAKKSKEAIRASGGLKQSLKSLFLSQDSNSIGMVETDRVRNPHHGVMSNEFYTEYVIPGNAPTTVATSFSSGPSAKGTASYYCDTITSTFYAEAGKDYEAFLKINNPEGYCELIVQSIDKSGNTTTNDIKYIKCEE